MPLLLVCLVLLIAASLLMPLSADPCKHEQFKGQLDFCHEISLTRLAKYQECFLITRGVLS